MTVFGLKSLLIGAALMAVPSALAQVFIEDDTYAIEMAGSDWCGKTASVIVRRLDTGQPVDYIPETLKMPLNMVMGFECAQADNIVAVGAPNLSVAKVEETDVVPKQSVVQATPQPAKRYQGRYFQDRFTGFYTYQHSVFDNSPNYKPEYFVIERRPDESLFVHSEIAACSGPLVQKAESDMLIPHPNYLLKDPLMGRRLPRSAIDQTRPEYFEFGADCPQRQFTIFTMQRSPRLRLHYVRAYTERGRVKGAKRSTVHVKIAATSAEEALKLTRTEYLNELEARNDKYLETYSDDRDHTDMILAEYAPYIGQKPTQRMRGYTLFQFGFLAGGRSSDGSDRPSKRVFERQSNATYSDVTRIHEAVLFKENPGKIGTRTVIIAPFPYGETSSTKLMSALLGFNSNTLMKSDYHMRQLLICQEGSGMMKNIATYEYYGQRYLREQLSGGCNYTTMRQIKNILGHFESGGQAMNPDRQSILTRMQGGLTVTDLSFPCSDYKPEFSVIHGIMRIRGGDDTACERPSQEIAKSYQELSPEDRQANSNYRWFGSYKLLD